MRIFINIQTKLNNINKNINKNTVLQILEGDKQIVIEYNKRYLELQLDIIKNPEKHDTENLLKVIRRMLTLSSIEYYRNNCNK